MDHDIFTRFEADQELLDYYRKNHWRYELLATTVANYLEAKIRGNFRNRVWPLLHKVEKRAKDAVSLSRNLNANRYSRMLNRDKVKDLAAVRLIFYFPADLQRFTEDAHFLEENFGVLSDSTLEHKQKAASRAPLAATEAVEGAPGRSRVIGYETDHFQVETIPGTLFWKSLKREDRAILSGLRCEVQMRTLLRHSYAEVEHDLRYKIEEVLKKELSAAHNKMFERLGSVVGEGDKILVKLFDELRHATPPRSTQNPQPMLNQEPQRPEYAYRLGRWRFDFKEIHLEKTAPSVERKDEIFRVDVAMGHLIKDYKQTMWNHLQQENPQFIHTITYDSTVARVCDWISSPSECKLVVQPARYTDQVVTNHKQAMRLQVPGTRTDVKDLALDSEGKLLPFSASPMANNLGVGCIAIINEDLWVISQRSEKVAYEPGKWGCSSSGALEWTELGVWSADDFKGWICGGMLREIEEELGLDVDASLLHYLGFFRELGRGGKPQIYFKLDLRPDYSRARIRDRFHAYISPNSEHKRLHFITTEQAHVLLDYDIAAIQEITGDGEVSEELRMNLALAMQHEGVLKTN